MRDVHRSVHPAFGYIWFLPNFYDYLIIRCWGRKVFWPLWYQIATCFALAQSSKTFVIRSFFFEKWLLAHVFSGSRGQKSSCKQVYIGFLTFWPWYHNKQNWCLFCSWAPWKPTCNSGKFLCKMSFSEKHNERMIIGLFIEMIKLNENKKTDFKRVRNWTYPLFWNETEKQISGRTVCKIKMHFYFAYRIELTKNKKLNTLYNQNWTAIKKN